MTSRYASWVFDCDGVLLDSNEVKAEAFAAVGRRYGGEEVGRKMAVYHKQNGGLSRFKKIDYLFRVLLGRTDDTSALQAEALALFGEASRAGLATCAVTPHAVELLERLPKTGPRIVVSGGQQDEVRDVLAAKGLSRYFDGIYGSPDSKDTVLARLRAAGKLPLPGIYVGDSTLDHDVAGRFGLDFVFLYGYTQLPDWREHFAGKPVRLARDLGELLALVP